MARRGTIGISGKKVALLRRRAGLSQQDLADKSDVDRRTIAAWEAKERADVLLTLAQNVAIALGVERGEITGEHIAPRVDEQRVYATLRELQERLLILEDKIDAIPENVTTRMGLIRTSRR